MRRSWALALLAAVFVAPFAVSIDPAQVGEGVAAACSGIAYLAAVPTVFPEGPTPTLPVNARTLVYKSALSMNEWEPKESDAYQVLVDGRAIAGKPRSILPGLFAVEPAEALAPGATVAIAWKDGTAKPTARYKVGAAKDDRPPVIEGCTTLTHVEQRSSCDVTRFGVKVPLSITDESPVVVAAWAGPRADGPPVAFARWVPGSEGIHMGLPGPAPELTLVAIDGAGNRSAPRVARLAGEANDAPPAGAPAVRERGSRRRLGCGKSR